MSTQLPFQLQPYDDLAANWNDVRWYMINIPQGY